MSPTISISSETIRDYLDRSLGPREEQAFEEALLANPELAEQVRAEMALRKGFRELARREVVTKQGTETPTESATVTQIDRFRRKGGGSGNAA